MMEMTDILTLIILGHDLNEEVSTYEEAGCPPDGHRARSWSTLSLTTILTIVYYLSDERHAFFRLPYYEFAPFFRFANLSM